MSDETRHILEEALRLPLTERAAIAAELIDPEAEEEVAAAVEWYEVQRPRL